MGGDQVGRVGGSARDKKLGERSLSRAAITEQHRQLVQLVQPCDATSAAVLSRCDAAEAVRHRVFRDSSSPVVAELRDMASGGVEEEEDGGEKGGGKRGEGRRAFCYTVERTLQAALLSRIVYCPQHGNLGPFFAAGEDGHIHEAHVAPDSVNARVFILAFRRPKTSSGTLATGHS